MLRSLLLVALLACPAWAADTILPATGKLAGVVITDEPGDWVVLASDLTPVEPRFQDGSKEAGWKVCIIEGLAGRYVAIKIPKGGGIKTYSLVLGGAGPIVPPPVVQPPVVVTPPVIVSPDQKATAATYIYEKDQGGVPPPVMAALNKLNRERGITATVFEQDSVDGTRAIPDQYKAPLAAAKEAGLPALVVMAGVTVLKVVKNPTTLEAVMGAVP